jgi:hypothetical protein
VKAAVMKRLGGSKAKRLGKKQVKAVIKKALEKKAVAILKA